MVGSGYLRRDSTSCSTAYSRCTCSWQAFLVRVPARNFSMSGYMTEMEITLSSNEHCFLDTVTIMAAFVPESLMVSLIT